MSVEPIIQALEKLIKLHEGLLDSASQKTELIKEGSVDKLQTLLVKEHKYVQALEQAEIKRQKAVEVWLENQGITLSHATITAILEILIDEQAKEDLENTVVKLTNTITQLKQQEQLNRDLIRQSLQFVELSLDMMKPSLSHMNYGAKQTTDSPERSVFDSKV
ncbi:flagellar protein FlgN [Lentibacillus sp. CBA3610]|uniref:flagellar protein FlgN n=1 Tax=Lentibacillus sp. CBA3610 TaxID=2518176 RepID=UPI001594F71A|nr:flagellar protein FlgN [Lentibacillus sp. CBA3610]QKY69943.1 flagellar protein FlgN [Lentibacillus sp. CBA3610]